MKKNTVKCHCGAHAVLRPASVVYGSKANNEYLYVCARYPACDSYVGVHKKSLKPLGTLADRELRSKRIQAHKVFNQLWMSGMMQKWQAYKWMQAKLGLNSEQAHIAKFSVYMCDELISICEQVLKNNHDRLAS